MSECMRATSLGDIMCLDFCNTARLASQEPEIQHDLFPHPLRLAIFIGMYSWNAGSSLEHKLASTEWPAAADSTHVQDQLPAADHWNAPAKQPA